MALTAHAQSRCVVNGQTTYVHRCVVNGKTTYSDAPCDTSKGGTAQQINFKRSGTGTSESREANLRTSQQAEKAGAEQRPAGRARADSK